MPAWLPEVMPKWILDITATASTLAFAFALTALVCGVILTFSSNAPVAAVKLLGSLMVLAMAFASNNGFVYAIAIFIVATLVTDLDFLEKLAAIVWDRGKYWDYRARKASPDQVDAKVVEDAQKELAAEAAHPDALPIEGADVQVANELEGGDQAPDPQAMPNAIQAQGADAIGNAVGLPAGGAPTDRERTESPPKASMGAGADRLRQIISESRAFEEAVKFALTRGNSPFKNAQLQFDVSLARRDGGQPLVIDALVVTPNVDFVIEIRNSHRQTAIGETAALLNTMCRAYRDYLHQQGKSKLVMPLGIFPHSPSLPKNKGPMIVLGFDIVTQSFANSPALAVLRNS